MVKVIAIVSGGLDSTTLLYHLGDMGYDVDALSFNYGQRHKKELTYAKATADKLGLRHDVVDLSGLTPLLAESGSSLVSGKDVPEGHYAEENMKATIVPNRNMMMLAIAGAIGVARDAEYLAAGVHAGDHYIYPDCRPEFFEDFTWTLHTGNRGVSKYTVDCMMTPFIEWSKADIAYRALELGVPLHETWSCYKGGDKHCGRCGTCVERLEAIDEAQKRWVKESDMNQPPKDETEYEDREFWKETVANAPQA
jgi:7-cyano-7-deazaguanine synthase